MLPIDGGNFAHPPPVPLLLLHGDEDTTVPISGSQNAFAKLIGTRWFVTFHGTGHVGLFLPPYDTVEQDAVVSFLNDQPRGTTTSNSASPAG